MKLISVWKENDVLPKSQDICNQPIDMFLALTFHSTTFYNFFPGISILNLLSSQIENNFIL